MTAAKNAVAESAEVQLGEILQAARFRNPMGAATSADILAAATGLALAGITITAIPGRFPAILLP
ncbi:hypothetical protein [Streptomyces sp. NPDC021356]|uniref:hypothetical protein n=1 Tax=Streptomyces sp. NPDC021356 TaxID=3154900 RepID=UPI0033CCA745